MKGGDGGYNACPPEPGRASAGSHTRPDPLDTWQRKKQATCDAAGVRTVSWALFCQSPRTAWVHHKISISSAVDSGVESPRL